MPACNLWSVGVGPTRNDVRGRPDTFLPLMKDWRSGVVIAIFFWIRESLATAFVNTLFSHVGLLGMSTEKAVGLE